MATAYQGYAPTQTPPHDEFPYPPPPNSYTSHTSHTATTLVGKGADDPRGLARTPSPTPSEQKELTSGVIDWKAFTNWRFWIRREWLWYYVALVIILVITALVTIFHAQIVDWLTPVTRWLHDLKFGWLVPIGILFVISFPPLFGHEIVAILCGLVWGLWIGFGIVAAGTFIGEVGNFYAFKYCCRARGEKMERTKISYACLAKVVREGGFKIALIARLSAIPGHFTTAVFSTCGMGIIVFSIAAILSLPKQFITVYLGVILEQSKDGTENTTSKIISDVVLAVTFIITLLAMWYIFHQMNKVKPQVIYERRKARQAKLARSGFSPYVNANSSDSTVVFNPRDSESDSIPLTGNSDAYGAVPYKKWDKHGRAVPGGKSNTLFAPQPQRVGKLPTGGYPRDEEELGAEYERGPRESTEDIEWDLGPMQPHSPHVENPYASATPPPPRIPPPPSFPSPMIAPAPALGSRSPQAQYANGRSPTTEGSMPFPTFFDDQPRFGSPHGIDSSPSHPRHSPPPNYDLR